MDGHLVGYRSSARNRHWIITLAASCAFMLPVATPPNTIVLASGLINIPQMVRAGAILNLIGMLLLSVVSIWLALWCFYESLYI